MSLANISIVGNLARAPEQMYFASGRVKTTLVVAVNGPNRTNRESNIADFYKVETWGKLAELAGEYLAKGNQVAVSGRLVFDRWTDRQGKERVTPVVEASQLALPPKSKGVGSDQNVAAGEGVSGRNVNAISGELEYSDASDPEISSELDDTEGSDADENWQQSTQSRSTAGSGLKTATA